MIITTATATAIINSASCRVHLGHRGPAIMLCGSTSLIIDDSSRVTLVLYRRRACAKERRGTQRCGARSIKPLEGSRWRGGRAGPWKLNGVRVRYPSRSELCARGEKREVWRRKLAEAEDCCWLVCCT